MRPTCAILCLLVVVVVAAPGAAQLGPDGTPITTSNYSVDITRSVVISTSRVTGLAGAGTSLAQGVEGGLQNPAAVAWRGPQWPDWYDYWLALGFTYPFSSGDFYNSGRVFGRSENFSDDDFFFLIPGAYWQMWNFGIGLTIDAQFMSLQGVENPITRTTETLRLRFTTFHIQIGYGFLDGQLMIGGGLRILREREFFSDTLASSGSDTFSSIGLGGEVGVMFQPHYKRWRLGASLYPELSTGRRTRGDFIETPDGDIILGTFFLPRSTRLPNMGGLGFSYQFGPRPTNLPWISVDQFAAEDLQRLDQREQSVREAEKREIQAVRAIGSSYTDEHVAAIEERYARKYAQIKRWRKEVKRQAWEVLRHRYRNVYPRRYHLLSVDLWFTGKLADAVGVESFLFQTVQRSGERISVSPRIGYETEVWPKRMKVRIGSYLEPSRFAATTARLHTTFGFDLNVLKWNVFGLWPDDYRWQVSAALDVASEYFAISLGIGGWY